MKRAGLYVFFTLIILSCKDNEARVALPVDNSPFTQVPSSHSGVTFTNTLSNSEYINIVKYPHFYDGGGVAIGDINNDGLADIYFSSNQWENKLYLNKGNFEFEDITHKAGVASTGNWKTGVTMADVNADGFLDIFVCTAGSQGPFQGRTQLFINNHDQTFTERAGEYGLDSDWPSVRALFIDRDQDGDLDAVIRGFDRDRTYINDSNSSQPHFTWQPELDTPPATGRGGADVADVNEDGLNDLIEAGEFPLDDRIVRTTVNARPNALKINLGQGLYVDVAAFAGIAATDYSWSPLLADFDNDGWKDLFITAGSFGRPNILSDLDTTGSTVDQRIERMPRGTLSNVLFRNVNGLQFTKIQEFPKGLSNGAAYGDLDNDGDLDLVVNDINSEARLLRNNIDSANYIKVKLESSSNNRFGVGASIIAHTKGRSYRRNQQPVRGWLSSVDPVVSIGLGKSTSIDSLVVIWPKGNFQVLKNVKPNQMLVVKEEDSGGQWADQNATQSLFEQIQPFSFKHIENSFNTLDKQALIPHASSTKGPKIAVADLNGDKIQDVFICGGQGQPGAVFIQTRAGKFVSIPQPSFEEDKRNEEVCAALFDVDGDRDVDLMIGSGGEEFLDKRTMMRLYLNNGRGTFTKAATSLPKIYVNATCIVPADVDNDKDLDVFVGGGVITGRYGFDSDSFILTNDGKGTFTGSPASFFERRNVGEMIQAAVWIDVNKDEYPDLMTAGDWTKLQVWINEEGTLKRQADNGIDTIAGGWWNSLAAADMDNDGDDDIVAGNFGTNQRIRSAELYVTDLDNNGSLEPIMSVGGVPLPSRDVLLKQVPALAKRFPTYAEYANVRIEQIVTGRQAFRRAVGEMRSMYIENLGNGKFKARELPAEAQFFPVFGINLSDINDDGNKDILLTGNLKAVPEELWRHDNGFGLVLTGNGQGDFKAIPPMRSGFVIKGEGRDIQVLNVKNEQFYLVGRNNDTLLIFKKKVR